MSNKVKFPILVDNSMRKEFVRCPQAFYRKYMEHWKPILQSIDLHAGKCFASAIEKARRAFWEEGLSTEHALNAGINQMMEDWGDFNIVVDTPKNLERMMGALVYYFDVFGWETDYVQPVVIDAEKGTRGIEFSFALPLDTKHPESGEPILFVGRNDLIGFHQHNNKMFIVDEKTTKQLGPTWPKKYRHDAQFTGYTWGARMHGFDVAGSIVRGIAILKTKYNHAEAIDIREQWKIDRWKVQIEKDVQRMVSCWQDNYWDYNLDDGCSAYGGCEFLDICGIESEESKQRFLSSNFKKRRWDPVNREEIEEE